MCHLQSTRDCRRKESLFICYAGKNGGGEVLMICLERKLSLTHVLGGELEERKLRIGLSTDSKYDVSEILLSEFE